MTRPAPLRDGARLELERAGGGRLALSIVRALDAGTSSQTLLAREAAGELLVVKCPRDWDPATLDADLRVEERILTELGQRADGLVRLVGGTEVQGKRVVAFERLHPNPLVVLARPEVRAHFPADPGTRWYPPPAPLALGLAVDLFGAVAQLQGRGYVHHDVKPANFMLRIATRREELGPDELLAHALRGGARGVLIDLGGARSRAWLDRLDRGLADGDASLVPPQLTPLYAPPEALLPGERGRPRHHPSLDVYAAATTAYALLTGRGPFDHLRLDVGTVERLRAAKVRERDGAVAPLAWEAVAGVAGLGRRAKEVWAVLAACVDPDPDQRPPAATARDRLQALRGR